MTNKIATAALGLALTGPLWGQASDIQLSFVRNTARIDPGNTDGPGELLLSATGNLKALAAAGDPVFKDQPPPKANQEVTFDSPVTIDRGDVGRRTWRIPVHIARMPPTPSTFSRSVVITLGPVTRTLQYAISNATPPKLDWKVSGLPTEWSIDKQGCQRVRVGVSGTRATGIGVTSTLIEDSTKRPLSAALFLSLDSKSPASPSQLEAAINDSGDPLMVCIADFQEPGKFTGSMTISAAEKPDGQALITTIYNRTASSVATGVVMLLIGVTLALVFRFVVPASVARNQALLPPSLLLQREKELSTKIAARPASAVPLPSITALTAAIRQDLSRSNLDGKNLIPGRFGSLFRAPDTSAYTALLNESSAKLQMLQVLIFDGVVVLDRTQPPGAGSNKALEGVDTIALEVPTPTVADTRDKVQQIVSALSLADNEEDRMARQRSTEQLLFQIDTAGYATLLAWLAISFISGLFILILNKPGFGAGLDYFACFIWGFGISMTGQTLTQNQAATALGIKMPGA